MSKLLKIGVYVAAGVGTYEVLRRTGLLQKATDWLEQNIPQELKDRAGELRDQARQHAEDLTNEARRTVREATGYNVPGADEGDSAGSDQNGRQASGPTITGPGAGVPLTTDDYDGAHVSHKVGRGVVR